MTLGDAEVNKSYMIISVSGTDKTARRLMDMGFTHGCSVFVAAKAPFGGGMLVSLRGFSVALRSDAASLITVRGV